METVDNKQVERRAFLDFSVVALLATFFGGVFYPIFRFLSPIKTRPGSMGEEKFSIPLADVPEGSAKLVRYKDLPTIIIHTEGLEVVALNAACTHLGCIVKWDDETGRLLCPCHGAVFDKFGQVKDGPAPKPLPPIDVKVEGNMIWLA